MVREPQLEPGDLPLPRAAEPAGACSWFRASQACFYWRCVYEFGSHLDPTADTLRQLCQALMLMVSTFLQTLADDQPDQPDPSDPSDQTSQATKAIRSAQSTPAKQFMQAKQSTAGMEVEASSAQTAPSPPRHSHSDGHSDGHEDSASPPSDGHSGGSATLRVDLSVCLQMLQRCKQLRLQLRSLDPADPADPADSTLLKLELACLARGDAAPLQRFVQSILQRSEPFSLYLELFYLLQQQRCALPEPKKECLRRALQMLMQQPTYTLDSVLEIIHALIEVSESRREEFHWAEQLLQIAKMHAEPALTDM